jgi:hypothetical protein
MFSIVIVGRVGDFGGWNRRCCVVGDLGGFQRLGGMDESICWEVDRGNLVLGGNLIFGGSLIGGSRLVLGGRHWFFRQFDDTR